MADPASELVHATSVAIDGHGMLIMGPSGSGKSDLALRLIDRGAVLVSDDYTEVVNRNGLLLLRAPENIAGKMEIRHLGLVEMASTNDIPATIVIRLDPNPARMPEHFPEIMISGRPLPVVSLAGKEPSAPIKAEWALRLVAGA